ncbi:MAG: T9SS type A sorting domain-containing protein [Parafilimonas sp.]|nr:T9SS type A sorting domain-containing protein [Parafilimonas sp.]
MTISSGASLTMQGTGNLTIANSGSITNSGTFDATASTTGAVIFAGTGTVTGTITFNNVTLNGSVDFGTSSTVTGILLLNTGGTVSGASTHLITYTSSSTLIYNETVTTGNEWYQGGSGSITPGAGVPQNVTIQNGTVTIPNSGGFNRALAGNLNISSGTTLQFVAGSSRDLYIAGNWTNSGLFTANGRRVNFDAASGTQTVSGTTTFYDVTLNNSGAITDFGTSTNTINDEFRITAGNMNAPGNTSTFIFNGLSPSFSTTIEGVGSKYFYNLQINSGTTLSDLTASAGNTHIANGFLNNGAFTQNASHTTFFDKSAATETFTGIGTTTLGKLVIGDGAGLSIATTLNSSASFTITGGSMNFFHSSIYNGSNNTATFSTTNATVTGTGTANFFNATANKDVNFGAISTIYGNLTLNDNGSVSAVPVYSGSLSALTYNKTTPASYNTSLEWNSSGSTVGSGVPQNISVTNTNSIQIAANRTVPGTLTLSNGSLDINGNTLTINGGFAGSGGTLKGSVTSNLIAGGSGTIFFNAAANYLKDFTINNGANLTLGSALNITASDGAHANTFGTLTSNGGVINAAGFLSLKSDAYGDAMIGQSSGTINGDVTVERYIPPVQRAWRFLGVPFNATSTQTIFDAWQEGQSGNLPYPTPNVSSYGLPPNAYNMKPGYGTEITFDNCICNGYDVNITYNPSLKIWDYSTKTWSTYAPHTNTVKLTDNSAYCLFIRGDRSVDLSQGTNASLTATTLRAKGKLNEIAGASVTPVSTTLNNNEYLFVGNPFAAPVDFSKLQINNADPTYFYVWDPKIGGMGHGVGAYVTYSFVNPVGWSITTGGSYTTSTLPVIQSGQAFFVQSTGGITSVTFPQNAKTAYEFSTQKRLPRPAIFVQLVVPQDSMKVTDGVTAVYGNIFSGGRDKFDAPKLWNFTENMALSRDTNNFVVEARPIPVLSDTLFLKLYLYKQPYALRIYSMNLPGSLPAKGWIIDRYLHTETEIDLYDTSLYNFEVAIDNNGNADTNSYRNRFMIVFNRQMEANPIPVTKAVNQKNPDETGISQTIPASGINLTPNPVNAAKNAKLEFINMPPGKYEVAIYSDKGEKISTGKIQYKGGHLTYALPAAVPSLANGIYIVRVINAMVNQTAIFKLVIAK